MQIDPNRIIQCAVNTNAPIAMYPQPLIIESLKPGVFRIVVTRKYAIGKTISKDSSMIVSADSSVSAIDTTITDAVPTLTEALSRLVDRYGLVMSIRALVASHP